MVANRQTNQRQARPSITHPEASTPQRHSSLTEWLKSGQTRHGARRVEVFLLVPWASPRRGFRKSIQLIRQHSCPIRPEGRPSPSVGQDASLPMQNMGCCATRSDPLHLAGIPIGQQTPTSPAVDNMLRDPIAGSPVSNYQICRMLLCFFCEYSE